MDPETLPISKMELFRIIGNEFQLLIIVVKISTKFLNPRVITKDHY